MNKEEIIKLHEDGLFSDEIAKILNEDKHMIENYLIEKYYQENNFISKEQLKEIINYRYNNKPFTEISKIFNISDSLIYKKLKKIRIRFLNFHYIDKSHITNNVLDSMIEQFNNGTTIKDLAKKYKLNISIVSNMLKSKGIKPLLSFNTNVFNNINTEEKAYWLGFLYADGCVYSNTYNVELSLQPFDIEHLVKFKLFCKTKNKVKLFNTRCRISIANIHFKQRLIKLGCIPRKSLILKFPDYSIFKRKSLIRHFIRGYFDGDGCLSYSFTNPKKDKKITISCKIIGTYELLSGVANFCSNYNIKYSIYKPKYYKNNTWELSFSKENSILFTNLLYKNCSIYLNRKYARYIFFKKNNFAVQRSDFLNNDEAISVKAKEFIHANTEITIENKSSLVS